MQSLKPKYLKILIPVCGAVGLLLRMALEAAIDEKGLMPAAHPAWVGLWILTAVTALLLLALTRTIQGPESYRECFPGSAVSAAGSVLAAIPPLLAAAAHWQAGPGGSMVSFLLCGGIMTLAGVLMILTALCRLTEKKPLFLSHVMLCAYFALKVLSLYQTWSFDPQLQDYCFHLFAHIALAMTAYHLAAFEAGQISHRQLWFWALAAVYLCVTCLDGGLFYAAGALWAISSLSSLRIRRERKQMEAENVD